jgi:hypothetical protein
MKRYLRAGGWALSFLIYAGAAVLIAALAL